MNRSFCLVWNAALGLWVVASEAAKSKSKNKTISASNISAKRKRAQKIGVVLLSTIAVLTAAPSWAEDITSSSEGGNWNSLSAWDSGHSKPTQTDKVTVASAKDIVVDDSQEANGLTIGIATGAKGTLNIISGPSNAALAVLNETTVTNGSINVDGSNAALTTSSMTVGGALDPAALTIKNGGTVNIGARNGAVMGLGAFNIKSQGTLNIGGGSSDSSVGKLGRSTPTDVSLDSGSAKVVFDHASTNYTFANKVIGIGSLEVKGGTTTLTGENTYTGGTTISGGTLKAGNAKAFATNTAYTLNGGMLDLNNHSLSMSSLSGSGGRVDLGSAALTINQSTNTSYAGVISGTGSLTKSGTGTTTLTGENTYTGGTTISAGSLTGTTTSLQGDILNNASLSFDQGTDGTYAGVLSGTGALTKSGTGAVTLSGNNTYSGGTTIFGGALSITEQKNLGTGDLTLSGGTLKVADSIVLSNKIVLAKDTTNTVNADVSRLVELSGIVSGDGALTKSGAGILVLAGNNGYTGNTDVIEGTLQLGNGGTTGSVTGDIELASSANLNFNRTDALTFDGNITGNGGVFINSGTVSFANGVGGNSLTNKATLSIADGKTTSVGGDYTQEASGTLKIGASSLTNFGKLNVVGTATFAKDAKIDVDVTKANTLAAGTMTKVIEADTLNSEGFVVKDNSALLDFTASVDGNNVNLIAVQGTENSGSSDNKATVVKYVQNQNFSTGLGAARVLDTLRSRGVATGTSMDAVVTTLNKLPTGKAVSDAVAQTLPLMSGSSAKVSSGVMQANGNVVAARQSSTANVSSGGRSAETGTSSGDGFISDGHAWVKPVGSWAKQGSRSGVSGYDAETYGIIGGMDGDINDTTSVGFALSYMNTKADGKGTSSTNHADIDAYQAMFYGQRSLGESFHNLDVTWQAGLGVNQTDGTRNINFMSTKATSDYTSYTGNLSAGLGRTFAISGDTKLTPSVRADYSYIKDDSYQETGADALNLNVRSNTVEAFLLSVNGDLNQRINDSLSWAASAGVGYDVLNEASSSTSSYAGGGAAFITKGLESSPWVMNAGVGVNYALDDATEITVRYDLEGRSDFLSQTATAKFTWVF